MPNYLLFLHEEPAGLDHVSPAEMTAIIQKYTSWKRRMQDVDCWQAAKSSAWNGRVLRRAAGQTSITDGPIRKAKRIHRVCLRIRAEDDTDAAVLSRATARTGIWRNRDPRDRAVGAAVAGERGAQ